MSAIQSSTNPIVKNAVLPPIQIQEKSSFFTTAKVKRYALYAFSALTAAAAFSLSGLSIVGVISLPFVTVSVPLLLFSCQFFKDASAINDYEDLKELKAMKESAEKMSFSAVLKAHRGISLALKHGIVSLEDVQDKFAVEYSTLSLSQILQRYSLKYLMDHKIMTPQTFREKFCKDLETLNEVEDLYKTFPEEVLAKLLAPSDLADLSELRTRQKNCLDQKELALFALDSQYAGRQERLLADLDKREAAVKRAQGVQKELKISEKGGKSLGSSFTKEECERQLRYIALEKQRIKELDWGIPEQESYEQEKSRIEQAFQTANAAFKLEFTEFRDDFILPEVSS